MNVIDKEEAEMFLLRISKFHQMCVKLTELMKKIEENPSIISSKDKQQSSWSKTIRQDTVEYSNNCLNHEKEMNGTFREFYENQVKKLE